MKHAERNCMVLPISDLDMLESLRKTAIKLAESIEEYETEECVETAEEVASDMFAMELGLSAWKAFCELTEDLDDEDADEYYEHEIAECFGSVCE